MMKSSHYSSLPLSQNKRLVGDKKPINHICGDNHGCSKTDILRQHALFSTPEPVECAPPAPEALTSVVCSGERNEGPTAIVATVAGRNGPESEFYTLVVWPIIVLCLFHHLKNMDIICFPVIHSFDHILTQKKTE